MTKRQYRQYAMLVRVRNFGDAHKEPFPEGSEGSKAFGVVSATVAQVDAFTNAKLTARRQSKKEKLAAKLALAARIGAIARTARVMAKTVVGADAKFPLPTRQSDVAVLQSGRVFVEEATAAKDAFIRCGLPATFLDELQQAVATLEQAINGRSAGKTDAVVAQKGIRSMLKKGVDAVASLDVLVANAFGHDHDTMNAWKTVRHVELAGKSAPVGAPPDHGVPVPGSTGDHPIPPATGEAPAQPPADHPQQTPTGDAPLLQSAS
jgi:hypothetical protein